MDKPYPKSRKIHTKSRAGCVECKRRHIRCDESRPICNRCTFSNRHCSYTSTQGPSSDSASTRQGQGKVSGPVVESRSSTAGTSPHQTNHSPQTNQTVKSSQPLALAPGDTNINLDHLELLHHFEAETCKTVAFAEEHVAVYQRAVVSRGLHNRHLMYQVLALSALHLSLQRPGRQEFYKTLAASMQADALVGFHLLLENIDETNCLDVLLFSHLVAMHVFCDTFNALHDDFNEFLERLVGCIRLLNGVNVVMRKWWPELNKTEIGLLMNDANERHEMPKPSLGECRELQILISDADLSQASIHTCQEALRRLQEYFDVENSLERPTASSNMIFAWLVTATPEFAQLLDLRKPEALVILAYYAVLLDRRREAWVIGDAGGRLFRRINQYLGSRWQEWLAWPLMTLGLSINTPASGEIPRDSDPGQKHVPD